VKRLAVLALVVSVSALALASTGPAKTAGVLAIVGADSKARLGHVDPLTLKFVGRSTHVG
jgi:hypothetical protein